MMNSTRQKMFVIGMVLMGVHQISWSMQMDNSKVTKRNTADNQKKTMRELVRGDEVTPPTSTNQDEATQEKTGICCALLRALCCECDDDRAADIVLSALLGGK